jgi:phosphoglycolate phosphatase-like HAD superfamily hydrolase
VLADLSLPRIRPQRVHPAHRRQGLRNTPDPQRWPKSSAPTRRALCICRCVGAVPAALRGRQQRSAVPGAGRAGVWLAASGFKLACLTNKPTAFAVPLLRKEKVDGFFSAVFGGDAFRAQADPLPLLRTCEATGLRALADADGR